MSKIAQTLIILAAFLFICPSLGQADIVYTRYGDKLFGTIQSPSFSVRTPYGKIRIESKFLKSISFKDGSVGRWVIETINNDQFSGSLLNDSVRLIQEDGKQRTLTRENIKRIWRECAGPSRPATTTIITMQNNDRFSGRFLNAALEIRANFITRSIQPEDINRLEFVEDYQADTKILLENGDLIIGTLKQNQFRLAPESIPELRLTKSSIRSIQFNAPKMILKAFGGSIPAENDGDGDGIPDYADLCMDTPEGASVGQDGCARRSKVARATTPGKTTDQHRVYRNSSSPKSGDTQTIHFDFNRYALKPQYYSALDKVAAMLSRNPHKQVEIQGHTDNIGTEKYNQRLSEQRAHTVGHYLVRKGVEKDRLLPVGFGMTRQRASNETEAGRALNRRVEILLGADKQTLAYRQ